MEFNKEDFSEMLFNPTVVPEKKTMLTQYIELEKMFGSMDFVINADQYGGIDRVLRYICFMYDMRTPLRKITSYPARKKKAMQLAGYLFDKDGQIQESLEAKIPKGRKKKTDEGTVSNTASKRTYFKDVMTGKSVFVNRMIVLYLRRFRNHEYAYLVAMEEAYFRNMEKIMFSENTSTEDKNALLLIENVKSRIDSAYQDVFLHKPDSQHVEEVFMVIEEEKMGISPEDMARRLAQGEYIRTIGA